MRRAKLLIVTNKTHSIVLTVAFAQPADEPINSEGNRFTHGNVNERDDRQGGRVDDDDTCSNGIAGFHLITRGERVKRSSAFHSCIARIANDGANVRSVEHDAISRPVKY